MRQKLGPRQLAFIEDLEAHGDLQGREWLTKIHVVNGEAKELDCCLGRACKLAGVRKNKAHNAQYYTYGEASDFSGGTVPKSVVEYFGFYDDRGCNVNADINKGPDSKWPSMIQMNDAFKLSFKEIAARLRLTPQDYFRESR